MKKYKQLLVALGLLLLHQAVFAQYQLKYSLNDSLETYNYFAIEVYDSAATKYLTGNGAGWTAFKVEVKNGLFNGHGLVSFNRTEVYTNGGTVGIVIKSLNDKELLNEEVAIPQPEEIRLSYTVTPGYVGELLPLQVGCIFSNGRVGTTTTYTDITWQMFTLTCRGDTLDPHFLFFPYYVDSPEFLQFTATFNGDTSVNHSLFLNCFYSDTLTFDFSGADGLPGKNGANGHDELAYYRNGRWGQNGEDGLHGTNLNVVLIPLQAEEGEKEMLKILFISDTFHHVLLINPDKALIRINLSGGDGGKGGDGGRGANGSENAENSKMARGGDGGSGGNGGQGGTGGEMYLITNAAGKSYAHLVQVVNSGGHGGAPGAGGKGGQTYVRVNAGFFEKMVNGSNGENGIPGKAGMDGYDGVRPVLWLVDDSELLQLLQESEGW